MDLKLYLTSNFIQSCIDKDLVKARIYADTLAKAHDTDILTMLHVLEDATEKLPRKVAIYVIKAVTVLELEENNVFAKN